MTETVRSVSLTIDDLEDITLDQFQVFNNVKPEIYAALKEDVAAGEIVLPVVINSIGGVIDGHQRLRAYFELKEEGQSPPPLKVEMISANLSDEEQRSLARRINLVRRQVPHTELRRYIVEQLLETPRWSNGRIASTIGCRGETVAKARQRLEDTGELPYYSHLIDSIGRQVPRVKTSVDTVNRLEGIAMEQALRETESRRGENFKIAARAELAEPSQQKKQVRQERVEGRSFAKACHALQMLNEASEVDPERAAEKASAHQAAIMLQVHESAHRWLYAFMEALEDRRGVHTDA